jgi:hypothetical protein
VTSVTRHQSRVWIDYVGDITMRFILVSSSTALAFLTNMSEKRKSASPSAIQVKNRRKAINVEQKLHIISRPEKGERIVDMCHDVIIAHSSVHTVRDNVDRIKESANSGTKVFVCVALLPQSYPNETYQKIMDASFLHFYSFTNKYIV